MTRTNVEYADCQITPYPRCGYGCRYCYKENNPLFNYRTELPFQKKGYAHPLIEAVKLQRSRKPKTVVVSFTVDPYPLKELRLHVTLQTLSLLRRTKHKVMLLTKSDICKVDFPTFREWHEQGMNLWIGSTLTSTKAIPDEPFSSPNPDRIAMLKTAHDLSLPTWASLEPWLPEITAPVEIIKEIHTFTDWIVIGKLNHAKRFGYTIPHGYYKRELPQVIELLDELEKPFLIKKELKREILQ